MLDNQQSHSKSYMFHYTWKDYFFMTHHIYLPGVNDDLISQNAKE